MTQQEFNTTNWHRGNVAKLKNGKEYLVKGIKGHGRWLLLYSAEYNKCFMADYNIVDCRTSDYEEPEELYLEMKRQKQAEAQARRDAEKQERLRLKEERKQRNLQEQERMHQEAMARKAAKKKNAEQKKAEVAKPKTEPKPEVKTELKTVEKPQTGPVAKTEPVVEQPKRKRQRIKINHAEKVQFK